MLKKKEPAENRPNKEAAGSMSYILLGKQRLHGDDRITGDKVVTVTEQ